MTRKLSIHEATSKGVGLEMEAVCKNFGEKTIAARNFYLQIRPGELCCLLDPSGCGKSTTLRMIAGLDRPDRRTIRIDRKDMTGIPPQKRNVGMVFQNYALFPHMDVFENIAYGITGRSVSRVEGRKEVERMLDMVRLPGYGSRRVHDLSGGEQQRVARISWKSSGCSGHVWRKSTSMKRRLTDIILQKIWPSWARWSKPS